MIATSQDLAPSEEMIPFETSFHLSAMEDDTRRTWEGWFSAEGIDWEDEIAPSTSAVFREAIDEYLRKNPVVLWDHDRSFPIGKVHSIEIHEGVGMLAKGEIFTVKDFGFEFSSDGESANMQILNKCNEVWGLMKSGIVKGLSWHGRVRKQWVWSEDLGEYIKKAKKVILISEVTITPIQVHPSAKITKVNTMAKALEMSKALPLNHVKDASMDKIKQARDAQSAYLSAMSNLEDGVDLPQEMVDAHKALMGAIEVEEPSEKALRSEVDQLKEQVSSLLQEPAPLRKRTGKPEGVQSPPSKSLEFVEVVDKALDVHKSTLNGVTEMGEGKPYYGTPEDAVKMIMLKSGGRIEHRSDFTVSPACQALLQELQGN